jgi:hypothetical protein
MPHSQGMPSTLPRLTLSEFRAYDHRTGLNGWAVWIAEQNARDARDAAHDRTTGNALAWAWFAVCTFARAWAARLTSRRS